MLVIRGALEFRFLSRFFRLFHLLKDHISGVIIMDIIAFIRSEIDFVSVLIACS